jgi:hypothetical protein
VVPDGTFVMVYLKDEEVQNDESGIARLILPFRNQPTPGSAGGVQLFKRAYPFPFIFDGKSLDIRRRVKKDYTSIPIGKTIAETVNNLVDYLNQMFDMAKLSKMVRAGAKKNTLIIEMLGDKEDAQRSFIIFDDANVVGSGKSIYFKFQNNAKSAVTEKNTVIADFSLPYMCCSDCAPINFVIPKEPVFLSLPEEYVCLKDGETPIVLPFTVSPKDGEIKAIVPAGIESGVSKDENGNPVFDPALTDPSLHGQQIKFTVDGDPTNCVITVYADVPLSVSREVEYNELKTEATVSFFVSDIYPNLTHTWNFGDGTTSNEVPSAEGKVVKVYQLPVNNDNKVNPILNVTNGFCVKDVVIEPIEFEENVDVTLNIKEKYCLDTIATGEVFVPFTNKSPQNGVIEILGNYEGLRIDGDNLAIDPASFKNFDEVIRFTLSGSPTSAKIQIGKAVEVQILVDGGEYTMNNGVLEQKFFLNAKLPDNANPDNMSFEWSFNDNVFSTKSNAEIELPVSAATSSSYLIGLKVIQENGCISQDTVTIRTSNPNFDVSIAQDTFCLQDRKFYPISISPQVQGMVLEGPGISIRNGVYRFRPLDTGLTSAGIVNIRLNGKIVLTLTMKDVTKANFTWEVTNGQLILTNTSGTGANEFVWEIHNLTPIKRPNRAAVRLKTTQLDSDFVNVKLTAFSDCGTDTHIEQEIKIREEVNTNECVPATIERIKIDGERLPKNPDISSDDRTKIAIPTISLYNTFNAAQPSVLNSGNFDGVQGIESLFNGTMKSIVKNANSPFAQSQLSEYFMAQIKLYFNVLHCQPHTSLEAAQSQIQKTILSLRRSLLTLKQRRIKFDQNNELKTFLNDYSNDLQVIVFIREAVQKSLIPEIL